VKALFVTDRQAAGPDRLDRVLESLRGAPSLSVQIREPAATDREVLIQTRRAQELLGPEVPLYVHRRFDLALAVQAGGVHLPAAGFPVDRVRANTPRGFRIGVSTHSAAEAVAAMEEGADLIVLGPIFDTPSKRAMGQPLGPAELEKLPPSRPPSCELYAIGGIDAATLPKLLPVRTRFDGVAAIRFFQDAADPRAVLSRIQEA
jgi:thiamine-phosphate pyrophosphorylase